MSLTLFSNVIFNNCQITINIQQGPMVSGIDLDKCPKPSGIILDPMGCERIVNPSGAGFVPIIEYGSFSVFTGSDQKSWLLFQ